MTIDLMQLPQSLANMLGTSYLVGSVISVAIVYLLCIIPVLVLSRKLDFTVFLIFAFFGTMLCVGIGWMPFFAIVIYAMMLAVKTGAVLRDWIAG